MEIYEHRDQTILQNVIFHVFLSFKNFIITFLLKVIKLILFICAKRLDLTGVKVFEQLN